MATSIPAEVIGAMNALLCGKCPGDISALFKAGQGEAAKIDAAWNRGVKLLSGAVIIFMAGYIGRSTPWRIITIVAAVAMGFKGVCLDICGGWNECDLSLGYKLGAYNVDVYGLKRRALIDQVNRAGDRRVEELWKAMQEGLHGKTAAFGKNRPHYSNLIEWAGAELYEKVENPYRALALVILGMEGPKPVAELNALLAKVESEEDFNSLINLGANFEDNQAWVLSQVPEGARHKFLGSAGKLINDLTPEAQALILVEDDRAE